MRQYDSSQVLTDEPFHELANNRRSLTWAEPSLGVPSTSFIPYSVVRVLVLHTPAALADVGSQAQLNALVAESIDQTNQSISNSGIVSYRLENVASGANLSTQIAYNEQNSNVCSPEVSVELCRYAGHRNWLRRSVFAQNLRDATNADLVVMFVADVEAAAGVAYIQHPNCAEEDYIGENTPGCDVGAAFNDFGYSVVSTLFATSFQVFAHENGHQLGMEHNRPFGSTVASYNWSFGRVVGGVAQSLMGVDVVMPRSLQYSNPNVNFLGTSLPSGTALEWNARTGAALAGFVGEFRDPQYQDLVFGAGFESLPLE
nr:M12 family metallo-peptidase [Pseudomarimonas arenosa]